MTGAQQLEVWRWPHREHSHFCLAGGLRWHYQRGGSGPTLLLLHGTGASLHSWSGLFPLLTAQFDVISVDLPGHGFSELPGHASMSLPGMATALTSLLQHLQTQPTCVIGHSAGAAIAARMCLDGQLEPRALVSINGALLALPGLTGTFFSASARILARIPTLPAWVAGVGGQRRFTRRLLEGTGSNLAPGQAECYRRLVANPRHVAAALRMMANWELDRLEAELPALTTPVHLIVCEGDRTVPPSQSLELARRLPAAEVHRVAELGHLGHEEDPHRFAELLIQIAAD